MNTDSESALKPLYIYLDHLKHENPQILNFSESVEMSIDIPRISIRDQDRLVSSVPGPSLLYTADGTGGASSFLGNLVVSLPTVATEIPLQSTALVTTSGSAGNSSNEGPRALTVFNNLIDNCEAETRIDHQVVDDDKRVSPN